MTRAQQKAQRREAAMPSRDWRARDTGVLGRWLRVLPDETFDAVWWSRRDELPAWQRDAVEIERARRLAGPRAGAGGGGCG